ncbi:pentapeptide repeat-containing protein [Nocardiopsis sp. YSL2]|uniref:pentapeptide repeat-containing protein n=1 Tax=Nocardiopsis sp. YSL2 TaxID=2939492 RepID=UPI0026F4609D|nr:pentapeptide repeat-containing protein [Nocardiopsis sp. YSL2]
MLYSIFLLSKVAWPLFPFVWEMLPDRSRGLLGQVPALQATVTAVALFVLLHTAWLARHWMLLPAGLGWRILGAWATAILLVALIIAALWLVLGLPGLETTPTVSPKALDAIATRAFAIVAGLGGVAFLVIAYQRQSGEQTRLFTERFTTAVAQLGEDQPAVRLGGVHALAHLADDAPTPGLRQMCVDVLCAYLRNPGPDDLPQGSTEDQKQDHHDRVVEHAAMREVRLTIVRTISHRLRTPTPWRECDYDFTGVTFEHPLDLKGAMCRGRMGFARTTFTGGVDFQYAAFTRRAAFQYTIFTDDVVFLGATFTGDAVFQSATFRGNAIFESATFTRRAAFKRATFSGEATFKRATFSRSAYFPGGATFEEATFTGRADFSGVTFPGEATFEGAIFSRSADFASDGMVRSAARGPCPQGLLAVAQVSNSRVLLPRWWTHPGRVRFKNPPLA